MWTFVRARLGMGTFSNDGSFMEQFLAMQKQGEAGAEEKIVENFDKCDDALLNQEEEGVERGNQGGNESSAKLSETRSTEAAQPSAPTEQPKAAAADSQKKKSLLAAFSTKKTIQKVGAFFHSSAPCRPFARIHMHFHVTHKSFSQAGNAGGKETKKLAYLVSFTSNSYLLGKATQIRVTPLPQATVSSPNFCMPSTGTA